MRAILRVLVPCTIVAVAPSCDASRLVAPSERAIGPASIATAPAGVPLSLATIPVRALLGVPGDCTNDSKLLNGGPTAVFGEGPGTWWGLVINGLNTAGFATDGQKVAYLEQVFGRSFASLSEAETYNLQVVSDGWDINQNGYVCAYELRGTRAHYDNPLLNITFFSITDDKVSKK
jgi:hypothetical protein